MRTHQPDRIFTLILGHKAFRLKVDEAKKKANVSFIEEKGNPCKAAWQLVNTHCQKTSPPMCPWSPEEFNHFFVEKVEA